MSGYKSTKPNNLPLQSRQQKMIKLQKQRQSFLFRN